MGDQADVSNKALRRGITDSPKSREASAAISKSTVAALSIELFGTVIKAIIFFRFLRVTSRYLRNHAVIHDSKVLFAGFEVANARLTSGVLPMRLYAAI